LTREKRERHVTARDVVGKRGGGGGTPLNRREKKKTPQVLPCRGKKKRGGGKVVSCLNCEKKENPSTGDSVLPGEKKKGKREKEEAQCAISQHGEKERRFE